MKQCSVCKASKCSDMMKFIYIYIYMVFVLS